MLLAMVLFIFCTGACSQSISSFPFVDTSTANRVQFGTTISDVQEMFGWKGEFGFQVQTGQGELLGLEFRIGSGYAKLFFIFADGELRSIRPRLYAQQAIKREKSNGAPVSVMVPSHPKILLKKILSGAPLFGEDLVAYAEARPPGERAIIPNNLIPAIAAVAINPVHIVMGIASELEWQKRLEVHEAADRKWAYNNVDLGMTQGEVEARFDEPAFTQNNGQVRGCVYGDEGRHVRIAIEYLDGRVHAKYGNQFYPFDWNGERRKAVLEGCDPESLRDYSESVAR